GLDHQFARPILDGLHGFNAVHHHVQNHLLQLEAISPNEQRVVREFATDRDAILHYFAANELDHLSDRSIDFEPISSRRQLFSEIADPADYRAGAIAVFDDVAQDFPEFVRISHLGIDETQRGLRVGDDGADWL